ncbi:helix-turn-helix domain-containing protein [uncultured Metabacillus sp.]|uniref:PucR family transcriptional regulator n=1 Tax=uncultured Metabacillus sp. TaxID=2860135 RepID=UPI00263772DE|nr:helix-turn-helix domain-containing protein [uncultured Metabacillus sp.]
MIENLLRHYQDAMTMTYNPKDTNYEWFQTEHGQTFGIVKASLSDKEIELLTSLFQSVETVNEDHFSLSQRRWFDYLFSERKISEPPLPADHATIRFYYFYLKQPIDEKQNFEEAVQGIIDSDLIIWLSLSHGIIIDEKPSITLDAKILKDLSDTLTTDFYVEPYLYIGQLQKNDADLREKFILEQSCFQALHRSAHREKALTFYDAMPLLIMTSPSAIKKDILSNQLIEAIEDKELHHTIEAFLQSNLNASSTAKRLFIHRNSLQYRLEKLLEKTGLDIRTFSNATFIFLATILVRQES